MAKPPETPPSSDIDGVNRDARVNASPQDPHPDPGGAIAGAREGTSARPEGEPPSAEKGG